MSVIDLTSALESLRKLEINSQTTDDASAAMKMLGNFNQCAIELALIRKQNYLLDRHYSLKENRSNRSAANISCPQFFQSNLYPPSS
jgi:hypothetical protein